MLRRSRRQTHEMKPLKGIQILGWRLRLRQKMTQAIRIEWMQGWGEGLGQMARSFGRAHLNKLREHVWDGHILAHAVVHAPAQRQAHQACRAL
eukprot:6177554-Pleurochrysis_carterae.AAC.1